MSSNQKQHLIDEILARLRAIDGDMDRMDEAAAARLELSRMDFRCLDILSRGGRMTPGQLSQETGLSTGATTALLDRLEKRGFIQRRRDLKDRRRVFVEPTRQSIDKVWPIFEGLVAGAKQLMGQFRLEELETVLRFLERQHAVVREHLPSTHELEEPKRPRKSSRG